MALLQPGLKDPTVAKNFRPTSLLCHTFQIFERLLLERVQDTIEGKNIDQQAGFRLGKSCGAQVNNLI